MLPKLLSIDSIKPFENNAKIHSEDQIEKLSYSIKKYGWTQPIVVDKNMVIIVGHGRREAAIKLGFKQVPVIVRDDLSVEDADKLRIADNKVTSVEYDMSIMREEISRMAQGDFSEWTDLGFTEHELMLLDDSELSEMTDDFFTEDIAGALEEQKEENDEKEKEAESELVPIIKALGFSKVTMEQSRLISGFINSISAEYKEEPLSALLSLIKDREDG